MKRILIGIGITVAAGWAQHGRGMGMSGAHGAPMQTPPATHTSGHPTDVGRSASQEGARNTPPDTATRVTSNPALSTRIQPLLPTGMTMTYAASGFRNQGQFLAAVHVSRNLQIPFRQVKAEMTGPDHRSLGKTIHDLRPDLHKTAVKRNVRTADREAQRDIRMSTDFGVGQEVIRNPRLASRIQALLPAGTDLTAAAAGFRNRGQFIAAAHVSHNLGIPFLQLKTELMDGKSLGQAISHLRPRRDEATVGTDVRVAEAETRVDIEVSKGTMIAARR